MKKIFTFAVSLSLLASMHAQGVKILSTTDQFPTVFEPELYALGISPDGKYVCGSCSMGEGVFVADLQSGEVKCSDAFDDEGGELRHVDNNGLAVGLEYTYKFNTGELSYNPVPVGYRSVLYEDLTNEGKIIVGSLIDPAIGTLAAVLKEGQEWQKLPIPADEDLMGLAPKFQGISAAKRVSGDGKVILGCLGSFVLPILWFQNEAGEYLPDFFPARFLKVSADDINDDSKPLYGLSGQFLFMSDNGKYVAMMGMIYDENNSELFIPVVYNTESKELIVYSEPQEIDFGGAGLIPTAISDDGTFIGCIGQPYFGSLGSFIMYPGETQAELFVDAFPEYYELLGDADNHGFSVPTGISADSKTIVGYTYYSDDFLNMDTPAWTISYVISNDNGNAVEEIRPIATGSTEIYSIDGRSMRQMTKGLNIVRNSDGTVTKILKK